MSEKEISSKQATYLLKRDTELESSAQLDQVENLEAWDKSPDLDNESSEQASNESEDGTDEVTEATIE